MSATIFNTEAILEFSSADLEALKERARGAERRRSRLCLHHATTDPVHNMVNVFCGDTYVRPHRHPEGKAESYHLIEGRMMVFFFDESGRVIRRIPMEENRSRGAFMIHNLSGLFHMPLPMTECVVFHETFTGPFVPERDVEYAPWAPSEGDREGAAEFLLRLREAKV